MHVTTLTDSCDAHLESGFIAACSSAPGAVSNRIGLRGANPPLVGKEVSRLSQAAPTALANPQRGNTRSHPKHDDVSSSSDDSIGQRCGSIKRCHSTRLSMGKLSLKNYFMSIYSVVSPVDHLIYMERFILLYHTMHHSRPLGSGNTVCWMFWPRTALLVNNRRSASLSCFTFSKQVLNLLIQYPCRCKEEGEN